MTAGLRSFYASICGFAIALILLATLANAGATKAQQRSDSGWKRLRRGQISDGIEFGTRRQVWLVNSGTRFPLLSLADPDEDYDSISLSPSDSTGQYELLIAQDDFRPGWLIDRVSHRAYELPLPHWIDDFVSWSPDRKHAVLHTSYEDSDQLWMVQLNNRKVREVHRKRLTTGVGECCGLDDWATRPGELAAADDSTLQWLSPQRFSFRLYTFCSPYEDVKAGPCSTDAADNKELQAFIVTVDVASGVVDEARTAPRQNSP